MECLIVLIVAGTLFWYDIISPSAFIFSVFGGIIATWVMAALYFKFGFLKYYYHDWLGWHTPDNDGQFYDGCNLHDTCRYCGKHIMQDSQGNWFTFE